MSTLMTDYAEKEIEQARVLCAETKSILRHCKKILGFDYPYLRLKNEVSEENYREIRELVRTAKSNAVEVLRFLKVARRKADELDRKARKIYAEFEKNYYDFTYKKDEYEKSGKKSNEWEKELKDLQKKTDEQLRVSDEMLAKSKEIWKECYCIYTVGSNIVNNSFLDSVLGSLGRFELGISN